MPLARAADNIKAQLRSGRTSSWTRRALTANERRDLEEHLAEIEAERFGQVEVRVEAKGVATQAHR
eukprot:3793217-Alexandrium_andersonii.AAC.1